MIPKEIFEKVRRIEITTSRLVTDIFAGQYHSVFKGRGMEFDEVREYQPGDDVRAIDWNVTARTGQVHIKKYVEERELSVMLLVDASYSCRFASAGELKSKLAAEIAAVLAFAAIRNNDKVGVTIFTDGIEKFIPPRKGTPHVLRVIREVLVHKPQGRGTDFVKPLEHLSKVLTRRAVVFVISDFFEPSPSAVGSDPAYKKAFTLANKRHDCIAISLNDPRENELPECGLLNLEDAESGAQKLIDSTSRPVREIYRAESQKRWQEREYFFRSMGVDHIPVHTHVPYTREFIAFFAGRRRRILRTT